MRTLILVAAAATALGAAGTAAAQMPSPEQIIKAWDTSGDGAVSKDEWTAAGRPAERFDSVDANHDGKITTEELGAAMAKMRQMRRNRGGEDGQGQAPPEGQAPSSEQPQ